MWYIYLSIINCVWMHRCECVVIALSYKCQCILICTYTVKWSEFEFISCVAKKFGVNRRWVQEWCQQMDKLQKLKKSFICRFGWKNFPSYYKYIHSRAIFVLEKGGVLLLGTVLLLGHNTVFIFSQSLDVKLLRRSGFCSIKLSKISIFLSIPSSMNLLGVGGRWWI